MQTHWLVQTNAKSVNNAQVLLNQLARLIDAAPDAVVIQGERYGGHQIAFTLDTGALSRADGLYHLLLQSERLANSWTLCAVSAPAHAWSLRSRIAGIQRLEWREGLPSPADQP